MSLPTVPPSGSANISANARIVLEKRYLVKDASGQPVEKPEEMFWRVATTIASKSPAAVGRIQSSFLTVEALTLREGFRLEQAYTTELSETPDAKEARRAFLEKREPTF